ncbi:hypothetical protein [Labrys monachus]|uniref:Uncharacterized protein n=1 Tax=Labrys monachus TaxID=217067 RepID=A0ABU0FMV5_9HYPH|nr:hypothetical protein [Labrys monachus]MDQ0395385.1 hypothetical protein [Labrys monachus]
MSRSVRVLFHKDMAADGPKTKAWGGHEGKDRGRIKCSVTVIQVWPLDVNGRPMVGTAKVPAADLHTGRFRYAPPTVFQLSDGGYRQ